MNALLPIVLAPPRAALSLDFSNGQALDPRVTFSRASLASLYDSTGNLTIAPNNLIIQSEFASGWTTTKATLTPGASAGFASLVEDNTTGLHVTNQSITKETGNVWMIGSCYVKAGVGSRRLTINLRNVADTSGAYSVFDIAGGQIGIAATAYGSAFAVASTIESIGGGVYRVSVTTVTDSTSAVVLELGLDNGTGTGAISNSYLGTSTPSLFIAGAQVERVTYQTTPRTYVATAASAYNGPRFNYDPTTLRPRGLLIEEARTNSLLRSQEIDNASWTKTSITVAANSVADPAGTVRADTLTASGANGTAKGSVTTTAISWTFSVWLKRLTGTGNIDITMAGSVYATVAITSAWARYEVTQTGVAGTSTPGIRIVTNGNAVYAWGAQAEAGAFASTFIPTTSAAVTRAVDSATLTGSNFSQWYNPLEGTFLAEFDGANSVGHAWTVSSGVSANDRRAVVQATNNVVLLEVSGGVTQVNSITPGAGALGSPHKTAFAYKAGDWAGSTDGSVPSVTTAGILALAVDNLKIGASNAGAAVLGGHLESLAYYNKRLPDSTLRRLTMMS